MNRQFKAAIGAVRDFIAGDSSDAKSAHADDKATRDLVASELLETLSAPNDDAAAEKRDRARQLFFDLGYFDEAVQELRGGKSSADRERAAQALGVVGSERATAHLIAALFDDSTDVRNAAEEALERIGSATDGVELESRLITPQTPITDSAAVLPAETKELPATSAAEPTTELESSAIETTTETKSTAATKEKFAAPQVVLLGSETDDPDQLRREEEAAKAALLQLQQRAEEISEGRLKAQQEAKQRATNEARLRTEADARRRAEEKKFQKALAEAKRLREEEDAAASAEHQALLKATEDVRRLERNLEQLRVESNALSETAAGLSLKIQRAELARREAAEALEREQISNTRNEAERHHNEEVARLRDEEYKFREASEEVTARRVEVEKARAKAEKEAQLLKEAEERMAAAEAARAQAEAQRAGVEADLNERLAKERRLLEETRRQAAAEQQRLDDEIKQHAEDEKRRMEHLEAMRAKAEREAKERDAREQQILTEVESLRIADAEARRRIEDAESRRRSAEQSYSMVADKIQRIEAEAHARSLEEENILAKLEAARRDAAVEAQARAEQEKRIREEIEMFHRLEQEERPRLEAAILQRTEAESRLQELRERLAAEDEAYEVSVSRAAEQISLHRTDPVVANTEEPISAPRLVATAAEGVPEDELAASAGEAAPTILAYLHSVDPYKRAAAVAELARSQTKDAFELISACFDDHSSHVRNAAARALPKLEPTRTVDLFNRAMEEGSEERRRNIGSAIAASGLAGEAIKNLAGDSREATYNALSILFVMAKSGEVAPLVRAIEEHQQDEIGKAAVKLLTLSGQPDVANAALKKGAGS